MNKPLSIFISYAHEDRALMLELVNHLSGLVRQGKIVIWQDGQILAGKDWKKEIDAKLDAADIVIFLVSSYFMSSDYIWNEELPRTLEREKQGECFVVPVLLRPCDYEGHLSEKAMLPKDDFNDILPVESKRWESRDQAFTYIVIEVKKVIAERLRQINSRIVCSSCGKNASMFDGNCGKEYCDFDLYKSNLIEYFGHDIPKKYLISIIGGVNSGRTNYIVNLVDYLVNPEKSVSYFLKNIGIEKVLLVDSPSQKRFSDLLNQYRHGKLAITPSFPVYFINIILFLKDSPPVEICIFDTAGEKFEDCVYHNGVIDIDHSTASENMEFKGDGLIIFIEPREDESLNKILVEFKDPLFGRCKDISFTNAIAETYKNGYAFSKVQRPSAICLSKFDILINPNTSLSTEQFVENKVDGFLNSIQQNSKIVEQFVNEYCSTVNTVEVEEDFKTVSYFAVAPHGNDTFPAFYQNRTPQGILAPFLWILKELNIIPAQ